MPDSPDYQKYLPGSNRFSLQDMGELAVRVNAPLMLDRRGDIVWYDDFRNGLANWKLTVGGANGGASLLANQSYHAGFYAQLIPATTSTLQTFLRSNVGNFVRGRIGFDIVLGVLNTPNNIQIQFDIFDGTYQHIAYLQYVSASSAWRISDETSTFQTILTRQIHFGSNIIWFPLKLVYDLSTQYYVRYIMGDDELDISTIQFRKVAAAATPQMQLSIAVIGDGTTNPRLNIAQAIITQSEP